MFICRQVQVKQRTTIEAICDFVRGLSDTKKTFVLKAHSEELCTQTVESFVKLWKRYGNEEADIIKLWVLITNVAEIKKPTFVHTSFQKSYSLLN